MTSRCRSSSTATACAWRSWGRSSTSLVPWPTPARPVRRPEPRSRIRQNAGLLCLHSGEGGYGRLIGDVLFAIGALETVAAAGSLMLFQLFLHPQMDALHSSGFQIEDNLALRVHAQERHLIS